MLVSAINDEAEIFPTESRFSDNCQSSGSDPQLNRPHPDERHPRHDRACPEHAPHAGSEPVSHRREGFRRRPPGDHQKEAESMSKRTFSGVMVYSTVEGTLGASMTELPNLSINGLGSSYVVDTHFQNV